MTRAIAALMLAALAAGPRAAPGADRVERRGREPALVGAIIAISDDGVQIRSELGATHAVAWDRVLRVVFDPEKTPDPLVEDFRQRSVDLWRARSRVERGDYAMGAELFERLFEIYRGKTHETALIVAEGILRCRIARGTNAEAVIPALEVARLRRAGVETDRYEGGPVIFDEETLLCPSLPPAWLPGRALARLERELADYNAQRDEIVAAMAAQYRRAAALQLGGPGPAPAPPAGAAAAAPGVRLLADLAGCFAPEAEARAAAIVAAAPWRDAGEEWKRAWAHAATGAALVAGDDERRRQVGIVHLLHVPVLFARSQPYLSIVALQRAAAASRAAGDLAAARVFLAELDRAAPGHESVLAESFLAESVLSPGLRPSAPSDGTPP